MSFDDHITAALLATERAGLLRTPRTIETRQGPTARIDGRDVVLLCSNNYLGHADHPALQAALSSGVQHWGAGAAASRLVSGTMPPHRAAERALADYVDLPSALLFSSGYAANLGALQALVGPGDLILSDALNHASVIDGCRLSRAHVEVYRHGDLDHAAALLRQHRSGARACLIVTDAIFSMDGDLAPVAALRRLADEHDAGLLVDEAHSLGIVGPAGAGLCAAAGIRPDALVGTLGKALGLGGAFVAGPATTVRWIENRARSFVFSTALAPALAAAIPDAVSIVRQDSHGRTTLTSHAGRLRQALRHLGLTIPESPSPIIPVVLGEPSVAMRASARLLELGVFVHGIRPPTVPSGTARLRVVPIATHSDAHLDQAIDALTTVLREVHP